MTDIITKDEYDSFIEKIVSNALEAMCHRSDVPTDNLHELEPGNNGVKQELVSAVLFTGYDALDGKSFASFEDEMSAAFAGSIIDHSEALLPVEEFSTYQWDSANHIQRVALNHVYADAKRAVYNHFRQQLDEEGKNASIGLMHFAISGE